MDARPTSMCTNIRRVFFIRRFMLFLGQCVILCLLLYETVPLCLLCVQWDFFGVDFNFSWEDNIYKYLYCQTAAQLLWPGIGKTENAGPSSSYNTVLSYHFHRVFCLRSKGRVQQNCILYSLQMMFQLQGTNLHYNVDHKISVHKYEQLRICFLQNGCKIHVL